MKIKASKGREHLAWYLILNPSEHQIKHIYANTRGVFDKDNKSFEKKKVLDAAMQNASLLFIDDDSPFKRISLNGISEAGDLRNAMTVDVSSYSDSLTLLTLDPSL